jgi:RNA polymerase sigma-70 factor (ECF subfamily)
VTRNRLIDRCRRFDRIRAYEQPLSEPQEQVLQASQPRPSEVAQAEDLWQKMLEICPPTHRPLLQLKRQGLSPAEVADRTGLHVGSVRRILRQLARQLVESHGVVVPPGAVIE